MNALHVLVRREFWEHRALWVAPLVVAVLLLAAVTFGHVGVELPEGAVVGRLNPEQKTALFALIRAIAIPLYLVMLIVVFFYLLDCLYAERKDRSILFWKSLPVADSTTVLAKLIVALLVVPLGVYLLALVTDLVFSGILALRLGGLAEHTLMWDFGLWLQVQGLMLVALLLAVLWYAPIAAYLLLVSAWARRNVFLWAVLPPILAVYVEEIATDTDYLKDFFGHRLVGVWEELGLGRAIGTIESTLESGGVGSASAMDALSAGGVMTSAHLWVGLLVAAAIVWGAARIRRYRDDT